MSDTDERDPEERDSQRDNSPNEEQESPELIVDTDWKEQVAREKEAAVSSQDESSSEDESSSQDDSSDTDTESTVVSESSGDPTPSETDTPSESPSLADGSFPAPPPASFSVLISMLFTQAMAMLGQMPDPSAEQTIINKPFAKHYIDTLEMLGEKTEGNLDKEESKMLSEALHALRMAYVNTTG